MTETNESEEVPVLVTPSELKAMVAAAVAEAMGPIDSEVAQDKAAMLDVGADESVRIHEDPGSGFAHAMIPLSLIDFNDLRQRPAEELEADHPQVQELKESYLSTGGKLFRKILVYRKDDRYMLLKGHVRVAALRAAGEDLIMAYIMPYKPPRAQEIDWVNGF